MLTKRQYFSIFLIFFAAFLLFQGMQLGKRYWTEKEKFEVEESALGQESAWTPGQAGEASETPGQDPKTAGMLPRPWVLYVGDENSASAETARQWALYSKRQLTFSDALPAVPADKLPELILLEGELLTQDLQAIDGLLEKGARIVCLSLPATQEIMQNEALRSHLGIRFVFEPTVHLHGIRLYPGFLLGGERLYDAKKPEEEKQQDLPLDMPWYIVRAGSKIYMCGILDDDRAAEAEEAGLKNEDMPALIWRHAYHGGNLYAIVPPFMEDLQIGMGLLSAIAAQDTDVSLYPVANVQQISLLGFPTAADENSETLLSVYGRTMTDLERNIMLPAVSALVNQYAFNPTFFFTPRYLYSDEALMHEGITQRFLRDLNEIRSEMGLSLMRGGDISLGAKLASDEQALKDNQFDHSFTALYARGDELEELSARLNSPLLKDVRTVLSYAGPDHPLLGYLTDRITLMQPTYDAAAHSYKEDLRLLGVETALGYSSMVADMTPALWPTRTEDQWQFMSKRVFSTLATYTAPFSAYDSVSATEADGRVRRFLALDYGFCPEEQGVAVDISGFDREAWFVLRCYGSEVDEVSGGAAVKIENGAWLIRADEAQLYVKLRETEKLFYR